MTAENVGHGDELDVFHCPLDGVRLIEASAGTGKTWAICGLVLRLLLERGLAVQQVLVVTFTEAATAELRERIRSRLAEVLAALAPGAAPPADPFVVGLLARLRGDLGLDDTALSTRLDVALHGFDEAAIFTIHGFCQRALADAPFSAGLPMVTEVLQDDAELRDEAVKDAWRAEVSGGALPPALADLMLLRQDAPQPWSTRLRNLLARPLAQRRWPAALDGCAELPAVDLAPLAAAHRAATARWQAERSGIARVLKLGLNQLNGTTYKADALALGAAAWDDWLASDPLAPLDKATLTRLGLYTRSRLVDRTKAKCVTPEHPFFDEANTLLGLRAEAERALTTARCWLLRRVLEHAETALRRHKRDQGLVAFDDMLFNLHERLHDPADPARAQALTATLRSRYPAALIDEFQDTDPLQFAIFRKLYLPADPGGAREPATLFLVGDPKQAIYSFRNADLPTYLQARALADAQYSLAHNQRSTPALVEALNRLFGTSPQAFMLDGLDYRAVQVGDKPRSVWIDHSGPALPGAAARQAALQLWRIPEDARDGLPLPRADAHALALQATAAEITRLLSDAQQGRITLDGRPLRAGDVAVLVRSHGQGAEVRRALAAHGVRSVELSQASVYHSVDAEELSRVLLAVLHPARERTLRAALATELFGRDAAALEATTRSDTGLLPEVLRFGAYRDTWQQRGVGVMLRQMTAGEGLAARLLQQPQGERRLTNWLHLAEALHQAEATHAAPQALLRWLERQRADPAVTEAGQQRLESDQNLVQIVTIHKSKGLEYPVVFCPFLWAEQRRVDAAGEPVAYHADTAGPDGGGTLLLDFRAGLDPAFDADAVKQRLALDAAAEDLRLVYVALTRAVHRCVLVVGCSARPIRGGKSLAAGSHTLLNWLVAGGSSSPAEWLAAKPPQTTPERVAAAWQMLAQDAAAPADPPDPAGPLPRSLPISLRDLTEVVAMAPHGGVFVEADSPVPLQPLAPPAHLPGGWSIGSYSLLSRGSAIGGAGQRPVEVSDQAAIDHDGAAASPPGTDTDTDTDADTALDGGLGADTSDGGFAEGSAGWASDDILRFPRGAAAGDCIHQVFEHIDFRDPAGWPAAIDEALAGLPGSEAAGRPALAAMLLRMLRDVCATPLAPGLRLGELPRSRRLDELEFHLNAPALSADALNHALQQLGYPVPRLDFGRLQGYLRGFIDLVFEHGGKTYVLDWKSNHLGRSAADFAPAACARAMANHGYHLQALVYSLALDRLLRLRRTDYRPEAHFGGVFYLFVRGVRPGWVDADGRPCGVYVDRPSDQALRRLAAVFDGDGVAAAPGATA